MNPTVALNVDCTEYYALCAGDPDIPFADGPLKVDGAQSHSWYIENAIFTKDIFQTIIGFPSNPRSTRVTGIDGRSHFNHRPDSSRA